LEKLGYVKKEKYEEAVRERDSLRTSLAELEYALEVLKADKKNLKDRIEFLKMTVPHISIIKNIGPRTSEKLERSGIKDIIDLIETSPEKIMVATGFPKERVTKIIKKALNLIKKRCF
jgi:hypothetical protein